MRFGGCGWRKEGQRPCSEICEGNAENWNRRDKYAITNVGKRRPETTMRDCRQLRSCSRDLNLEVVNFGKQEISRITKSRISAWGSLIKISSAMMELMNNNVLYRSMRSLDLCTQYMVSDTCRNVCRA